MIDKTIYNKKQSIKTILEEFNKGRSLISICNDKNIPDNSTFINWVAEDEELAKQYAYAREIGQSLNFEELEEIARNCPPDKDEINKARLLIDTKKWQLSKQNPKKYGDKQNIDHTSNGKTLNVTIIESK